MTDKMREEFERTSVRDTRRQPPKGNNYIDPMAQMDWLAFQKGWKASREALVIELPNRYDEKYQEYFDDVDGGCFNAAKYLADAQSTIEAAGLKVK